MSLIVRFKIRCEKNPKRARSKKITIFWEKHTFLFCADWDS